MAVPRNDEYEVHLTGEDGRERVITVLDPDEADRAADFWRGEGYLVTVTRHQV